MKTELVNELQELCRLHGQATCDYSKCEPFYKRLALYLDAVEEAGEFTVADGVIEALTNCVPNPSGSCKTSDRVASILRKLEARTATSGGGPA